jgi:hypothetical protein
MATSIGLPGRTARIAVVAELQRKHPKLPVYVTVSFDDALPLALQGTTVVEGSANGHPFGRRSIKRWDNSARSAWFIEFTAPFCAAAGIAVGDRLTLEVWCASTALPVELAQALEREPGLRAAWDRLPAAVRRAGAEHVHAAVSAATRVRRARRIVERLVLAPAAGGREA